MLEQLVPRRRRPWWLGLAAVALLVATWATQQLLALAGLGWLVWVALGLALLVVVVLPGVTRARLRALRRAALAENPEAAAWIVSARSGNQGFLCILIVDGAGVALRSTDHREARAAWGRVVELRMGGGHVSYLVVKLDDGETLRLSPTGNSGYLYLGYDAKKAALQEIRNLRSRAAS